MALQLLIDYAKGLTADNASETRLCWRIRSSKAFIVSACVLAIFTDSFSYAIAQPVLPYALTQRAGVSPTNVEVWTSALLACYAGGCILAAPLVGHFTAHSTSRRTIFIIGLLALGCSTVLLCVGSSTGIFVLARIFQGVSSAFTWTVGFTLAVETVEDHEVGKMMGICSLGMSLALFLGPLVGGVMFQQTGYYPVFAVAFGLVFLDMVWRLALIETSVAFFRLQSRREVYWTMAYGINGTPRIVPSPVWMEIPDLEFPLLENESGNALLGREVMVRRHGYLARLTASLARRFPTLRNHRLQVALWASFAHIIQVTVLDAMLPLLVREVFSWGAEGAGLFFIPAVLPAFMGPYIGSITDKYGPKWLVSCGFFMACPIWILFRLVDDASVSQIVLLCFLLVMLGLSMTLAGTPFMAEITFALQSQSGGQATNPFRPRGAIAKAYTLYSLSLASGLLVGPLWAGLVKKDDGWYTMAWTLGLLSGITTVLTLFMTGGPLKARNSQLFP